MSAIIEAFKDLDEWRNPSAADTRVVGRIKEILEEPKAARREPFQYHASQLVDLCSRYEAITDRLMENGTAFIEELTIAMAVTFDLGHAMHDWFRDNYLRKLGGLKGRWGCRACGAMREGVDLWQTACTRCGNKPTRNNGGLVRNYIEYSFKDKKTGIVGSVDGVLVADPDRDFPETIFELKTKNRNQFTQMTKADINHVFQVQVYMYLSGIRHAIIVYVCKEWTDMPLKEFTIEYDPSMIAHVFEGLKTVKEAHKQKNLKLATPVCASKSTPRAKKCPYVGLCFGKQTLKSIEV